MRCECPHGHVWYPKRRWRGWNFCRECGCYYPAEELLGLDGLQLARVRAERQVPPEHPPREI